MFKHLLNESAVLKAVKSFDEFNSPVFDEPKTIKCKFEFVVKNDNSDVKAVSYKPARMFCTENISVGDVVVYNSKDYKVFQVNTYNGFGEHTVFNEVFLS